MSLENKSFAIIGYGVSGKAMCDYLLSNGVFPTVRTPSPTEVPKGVAQINENYLCTREDVIIRSPSVRPDKIKGKGAVTTEAAYALEITKGFKIGVSGSSGKTTSVSLIYEILRCDGKDARLCGNIGTPIIAYAPSSTEKSYTVCELSSFQLMDACPSLDVALLTNISENHLDWHTDMREYEEAKSHLLKNAALCVLNYDDTRVRSIYKGTGKRAFFSLDGLPRSVSDAQVRAYLSGNALYCNGVKIIDADDVGLRGRFNIANALGAACAVWDTVDIDSIRNTLRTFKGVSGRMELVDTLNGVDFISSSIDSTPSRTVATLSALNASRCVVILGGYDKGVSYEPLREAMRGIRGAVLIGANADKIEHAIKDSAHVCRASTLKDAVEIAFAMARTGDTVLLSPASASFDMFENYKDREEKFKEAIRGLKWKKSKSF